MKETPLSRSSVLWMVGGILVGVMLTLAPIFIPNHKIDLLVLWITGVVTSFFFARRARNREGIFSPVASFYRGFILMTIATSPLLWVWW